MQVLKVKVKPQKNRLDQFVSDSIKSLSRSKANKLIKDGHILVNKVALTPNYRVKKGDNISVEIPVDPNVSLKPEKIPLKIIFEDDQILVIDKQAGLVTHPTQNHPSGTLVNALLSHLGEFDETSLRPGIVHRLDKDTSGLIVVAKNQISLDFLKDLFKSRKVKKKYTALVSGVIPKERGEMDGNIERHPKFKQKFTVSETGKAAQTLYIVLKRFKNYTLLELQPMTGRTHQIRVHLSHLGFPIVGDKLYGGKMILKRQFLHASNLEIIHPVTLEALQFSAPLPRDLREALEKIEVL